MCSLPVFRLAAWGWLTGCGPSPGWEEASDWVGARKGTNECQGKTGTDRGSTLVHTAEEESIVYYQQLTPSDVHNLIIHFPAQISRCCFLIWGTNKGPWRNTPISNTFLLQWLTFFFYCLGVTEPQINWKRVSDKWEPTASECSPTGCTAHLALILVNQHQGTK